MREYRPEEIPKGRFCRICEKFFPDGSSFVFINEFKTKGHTTTLYLDQSTGAVHGMLSEAASNRVREKLYEPKPEQQVLSNPPANPVVVALEAPPPDEPLAAQPEMDDENDREQSIAPSVEPAEPDDGDFEPQPDEWFQARIINKPSHPDYWFGELTNGDQIYIHRSVVIPMWGNHKCLRVDDDVSIRLEKNTVPSSKAPWVATELFVHTPVEPQEMETGTITRWYEDGRGGWVTRDGCGCNLKVVASPNYLKQGDRVEVSGFVEGNKGWFAYEIQPVVENDFKEN